ncbi:amino acid ABC transporter permease [Paracandidimonas soli]|uniref:General L-amino acid transport system permease protein n=1 Tax=Paracandidimonas soli TaxID=1917182 RepID=A0A4R3VHN3_9BURK|nr:ABC transporter permease subunit [Paracandidimonas soli]TCV03229.1 general L-amino acid transport system permease protein [Paracandidimonas soli]
MLKDIWYSGRVRAWLAQAVLLAGLIALLWWIGGNTVQNLATRGIRTGFDFLSRPARFPISESVLRYSAEDSFLWAFVVGLANTLWVSALTIVLATILGLGIALARLSAHPILSRLAAGYVTLLRNVPLIVVLLFCYSAVLTIFPPVRHAWSPLPGVYFSMRGAYVPELVLAPGGMAVLAAIGAGLAGLIWISLRRRKRGANGVLHFGLGLLLWGGLAFALWQVADRPVRLEMPELRGLNFRGGHQLSPEFCAIIFGLTLYTAAFVGEVIRGGITAVSRGQWEGGSALGLTDGQIMFRIIMPQALRVIIPPMTSQYLSTVKNTTLAVAVGYPELGLIVNTVINQTGQALESITIMLAVFLTISLSVSGLMNWLNARVALVER